MKYLNEFSSLSHSVYVLRKRHKKRLISGNLAIYAVHVLGKVLQFYELLMLLLKISLTEASVRMLVPSQDAWVSAWRPHTNLEIFL